MKESYLNELLQVLQLVARPLHLQVSEANLGVTLVALALDEQVPREQIDAHLRGALEHE